MKLLVVSTWWPWPPDNGSRVRAYELLRELSKRHVVTLVAFGRSEGEQDAGGLEPFCGNVHVVPAPSRRGALVAACGWLSPVPRHFVEVDSRPMRRLVQDLWSSHDAAIALEIEAARYVASRQVRIPRIFEEVELTVPRERALRAGRLRDRLRYGLTWTKHRRFVRQLVSRFEGATVASDDERRVLESIGIDPGVIRVVPNGVRINSAPTDRPRRNRVIYPGSVRYDANLDAVRYFVRDILPRVRRSNGALEFMVTGDTATVDLRDLQVPGVTFTGAVPDVDPLIRDSAACVVPLRVGGGTRLKVLQAMSLGTPVVSTSKGVEGLAVQPGVHAAVADTPQAFAQRVLDVLARPKDACRMAAEARVLVRERYDWASSGAALEGALEAARIRFARAHRDRAHDVPNATEEELCQSSISRRT